MKTKLIVAMLSILSFLPQSFGAEISASVSTDVFRIEMGQDYKSYSNADLQRRVWELERAVWQLQQKVFELQAMPMQPAEEWICTVKAMGNVYTGTGATKAVATSNAIEGCKAGQNGDGFFCKKAICEK